MPGPTQQDTRAHRAHFRGLFFDETVSNAAWIREVGILTLPPLSGVKRFTVVGEVLSENPSEKAGCGHVTLVTQANGTTVSSLPTIAPGLFEFGFEAPSDLSTAGLQLSLSLKGVGFTNFLAWLGRVTKLETLQPYRRQPRNRRLRIKRIEADGAIVFDFSQRSSPYSPAFARKHIKLGLNIVGFFTANLGIGESVRCAAKAADAATLPVALVDLKLNCKNSRSDMTFASRLQADNPHPVNVFHIDAPQSSEIDHHHGTGFRKNKYNIAYWAWETPEFPDAWVPETRFYDEIWTPSAYVRDAIAPKVPIPVLSMPHAIQFERPQGNFRGRFKLPTDKFLFLFVFDLNSYAERKNPQAVLTAYQAAFPTGTDVGLVIKIHNIEGNRAEFERLRLTTANLPNTTLITETLSRAEVYQLQSACDCFISLHRAEGFGLALAESMYLGKPVIATNWSASTEFINAENGCPVNYKLVTLEQNHGPYGKGQVWAEADVEHAAWWMKQLYGDRSLAAKLGRAGQLTIAQRFSPSMIGQLYRRRLEAIASW